MLHKCLPHNSSKEGYESEITKLQYLPGGGQMDFIFK